MNYWGDESIPFAKIVVAEVRHVPKVRDKSGFIRLCFKIEQLTWLCLGSYGCSRGVNVGIKICSKERSRHMRVISHIFYAL